MGVLLVIALIVGVLASGDLVRGGLAAHEGDEHEQTPAADNRSNTGLFVMIACAAVGAVLVLMGGAK